MSKYKQFYEIGIANTCGKISWSEVFKLKGRNNLYSTSLVEIIIERFLV